MKKIYTSIFIVILIASVALAGESAPKIKIVTSGADIGEMQKGRILDFKVEVKSAGAQDLIIENVYSSCGCFEVADPRWPKSSPGLTMAAPNQVIVKPGESIFITVKLDTNKIIGAFEKQLHIISNDPETRDAIWKIKGNVIARAEPEAIPGMIGIASSAASQPSRNDKSVVIMLFYSPGCNECMEIKDKFLPGLKKKYGDKIWIEEYNADEPDSFAILLDLQNKYDKKAIKRFFNPKPPAVFAGGRLLYGVKDIKKRLEGLLRLK